MGRVVVSGSFDDLRSRHVRLLHEASRLGSVHVLLWSDDLHLARHGDAPGFPQAEREYFLKSMRYADRVTVVDGIEKDELPAEHADGGTIWVVEQSQGSPDKEAFCRERGLGYCVMPEEQLQGFPEHMDCANGQAESGRKKVLVTGCFDWFHSGHVRFFEEASQLGDLYVVVGHDRNLRLLKGEGHPLYLEDERRYMAGSVRFVKRALVSTGEGWLDAEPEIGVIKPDVYVVNDDGDRPEKQEFCQTHGIGNHVLQRKPKEGLPKRESTALRGF